MKARVIETGKWIDVCRKSRISQDVYVEYGTGEEYYYNQLVLENEDKISSYWFDLRNQYAGMAMGAIISDRESMVKIATLLNERNSEGDLGLEKVVAERSVAFADALVAELRRDK